MYNKIAVKNLKKLLVAKFPKTIDRIILYGSRIGNTNERFSDYDILVILKSKYDWKLKKRIRDTAFDIDVEYNILTDMKVISSSELNSIKSELPFIQEALSRGLVI